MPEDQPSLDRVPEARIAVREKTRISIVWIIPIVAAVIGAWVAVVRILSAGPEISIVFDSAEGLEAGKTKVRYDGVDIGTLATIRLSDDHQNVIATAEMAPETEGLLVEDTRFWVVRPRISGANVSGLGTLISGAYIGMEIGRGKQTRSDFTALATPPVVTGGVPGRFLVLKTSNLGSLDSGTPIFFRRLQVGEVASYELDPDGKSLTVKVFVNAPYDQYVRANTRFWHASGIDLSLSADGLTLETQSLLSLLIGGIAFETPATDPVLPGVEADTVFTLFDDREAAFALPPQHPQTFVLLFQQSVRGLAVGAPVELLGIPIGEVTGIHAQFDARTAEFSVPVTIRVDGARLGVKILNRPPGEELAASHQRMDLLVSHGLRLQLQSANLLTGAMMVTADFFPDAPPFTIDWSQEPVQLPTAPGGLEALESSLTRILKKLESLPIEEIGADTLKAIADLDLAIVSARGAIDHVDDIVVDKLGQMPFESIGDDVRKAIEDLDATLVSARRAIDSVDLLVQPSSALAGEVANTLQGVARAARDLGLLMDYLERHPEALIRGKAGEAK